MGLFIFGTFKNQENPIFIEIYPFITLIWTVYLDLNFNKIWKEDKMSKLSITLSNKIIMNKNKELSCINQEEVSSKKINLEKMQSQLEIELREIPEEQIKETVNEKLENYIDYENNEKKEIKLFGKRSTSAKSSKIKISTTMEEDEIFQLKSWYKIVKFYRNYNLLLKLKFFLYLEEYLEIFCLLFLLISYKLISNIGSLVYLFSIWVLCFHRNSPKVIFLKNFCLIFFNVKYLCFFFSLSNDLKKFSQINLAKYSIANYDLPSSYFSVEFNYQEFWGFIILFIILFALHSYIKIYMKAVSFISNQIKKFLMEFNKNSFLSPKNIDYNKWETENHWWLKLESLFFQCFDKLVILSVALFSILDFYLFNFIIFITCIIYIFLIDFQTKWQYMNEIEFKAKYLKYLQYFSFLAICVNHLLLVPQVSDACSHFFCLELGTKSDKLYNIFILQVFSVFHRLGFYDKYPKFIKIEALRVKFRKIINYFIKRQF